MVTLNQLIAHAQEVRDERQTGKNTATRVGQLFYDIVLFFNCLLANKQNREDVTLGTDDKTVAGAINELKVEIENVSDAVSSENLQPGPVWFSAGKFENEPFDCFKRRISYPDGAIWMEESPGHVYRRNEDDSMWMHDQESQMLRQVTINAQTMPWLQENPGALHRFKSDEMGLNRAWLKADEGGYLQLYLNGNELFHHNANNFYLCQPEGSIFFQANPGNFQMAQNGTNIFSVNSGDMHVNNNYGYSFFQANSGNIMAKVANSDRDFLFFQANPGNFQMRNIYNNVENIYFETHPSHIELYNNNSNYANNNGMYTVFKASENWHSYNGETYEFDDSAGLFFNTFHPGFSTLVDLMKVNANGITIKGADEHAANYRLFEVMSGGLSLFGHEMGSSYPVVSASPGSFSIYNFDNGDYYPTFSSHNDNIQAFAKNGNNVYYYLHAWSRGFELQNENSISYLSITPQKMDIVSPAFFARAQQAAPNFTSLTSSPENSYSLWYDNNGVYIDVYTASGDIKRATMPLALVTAG